MKLEHPFYTENFTYDKATDALKQYYDVNPEVGSYQSRYSDLERVDDMSMGPVLEPSDRFVYSIGDRVIARHDYLSNLGDDRDGGCKTIHTISTSATFSSCYYPGLELTTKGMLLYASDEYLGKGVFGNADNDSSTQIVDDKYRDLSALGISTGDIVINLQDGSTAEITSISTTSETNDTLEFDSFSDGGSISTGDAWAVFIDEFANFNTSTFPGQPDTYQWSRQILNFYSRYYILNGNSIAVLDSDETTFYPDYITLPSFHHANSFDYNQSQILIGAEQNQKGALLLWQAGNGDAFNAIVTLPYKVRSVKAYESGWLVFAGTNLYYTNGYTLEKITSLRDVDELTNYDLHPQGMKIMGSKVFLNAGPKEYNRGRPGVHVYDMDTGYWDLTPVKNQNDRQVFDNVTNSGIFYVNETLYASYQASYENIVSEIQANVNINKSDALYYIPNDEKGVRSIELYLGIPKEHTYRSSELDARVLVGVTNGKRQIFDWNTGDADAGNNFISVNYNYFQKGDLVKAISGSNAGEIVFVDSVQSGGVYIDPHFTNATSNGDEYIIYPIKKLGEYNLSGGKEVKVPMYFNKGNYITSDFFLYIHIDTTGIPLEVRNVIFK